MAARPYHTFPQFKHLSVYMFSGSIFSWSIKEVSFKYLHSIYIFLANLRCLCQSLPLLDLKGFSSAVFRNLVRVHSRMANLLHPPRKYFAVGNIVQILLSRFPEKALVSQNVKVLKGTASDNNWKASLFSCLDYSLKCTLPALWDAIPHQQFGP